MKTTGLLTVNSGVSRLNGTRLAIQGDPNPFGAATNFLANRGLGNNDFIWVTGSNGFVGNVPVIFITDAGPAAQAVALGVGAAKATKGGANKSTQAAKKSGGKKSSAKKKAAGKKGGAKAGGKRASAKKAAGRKSGKAPRKRQ